MSEVEGHGGLADTVRAVDQHTTGHAPGRQHRQNAGPGFLVPHHATLHLGQRHAVELVGFALFDLAQAVVPV